MIKIFLVVILHLSTMAICAGQEIVQKDAGIVFHINETIKNEKEDYFVEIIQKWKKYLTSNQFVRRESPYWHYDQMTYPDYSYVQLLLDLRSIISDNDRIQCNIIGVIPVENNHYLIKSMFSQVNDSTNQVTLKYLLSVYAKKLNGEIRFVNSTQYHKDIWESQEVGEVTYYIHPEHDFDESMAIKMNDFNKEIAKQFEVDPIKFDYVVANNTTQLNKLMGFDFNSYSYRPVQSGGLTDNYNGIIYAGNNSEYYPHEVVHLYTHKRFSRQYHPWVDEGIAALFGGSMGYYLDWHLQKLKLFLKKNPDYKIKHLAELERDIPNEEYTTDFRYAIGGLVCKRIFEKEGMPGLFDALQAGRREEDYFRLIDEKLGVKREKFEAYIKNEMLHLKEINDQDLEKLKY